MLHDRLSTAALLLSLGANIEEANSHQQTSLHWSVFCNNQDLLAFLIEKGANANAQNGDGETAMHWAAGRGDLKVLQQLLDAGADVDIKTNDGQTPIFWAAKAGQRKAIALLVNYGSNLHVYDNIGSSLISVARHPGELKYAIYFSRTENPDTGTITNYFEQMEEEEKSRLRELKAQWSETARLKAVPQLDHTSIELYLKGIELGADVDPVQAEALLQELDEQADASSGLPEEVMKGYWWRRGLDGQHRILRERLATDGAPVSSRVVDGNRLHEKLARIKKPSIPFDSDEKK